jgi:hypothetical protein
MFNGLKVKLALLGSVGLVVGAGWLTLARTPSRGARDAHVGVTARVPDAASRAAAPTPPVEARGSAREQSFEAHARPNETQAASTDSQGRAPDAAEKPAPAIESLETAASIRVREAGARTGGAPGRARRSRAAERRDDGLEGELALLREASRALDLGQSERALGALEQHRVRFRHGSLEQEREGLIVVAHCLIDPADGRARAEAFLAVERGSVLASRIRRACGAAGAEP